MTDDRVMFVVNTQCVVLRGEHILMIVRGAGVEHAPGVLAFPGGKVEIEDGPADVLELPYDVRCWRRRASPFRPDLEYVRSVAFSMNDGTPVVDVLFLGEYEEGEPEITDPDEVAEIRWMTMDEILAHDKTPPWLKNSIEAVRQRVRRRFGKTSGCCDKT